MKQSAKNQTQISILDEYKIKMNSTLNKIEIVKEGSIDEYSRTFQLNQEDHTLSNALRYLIMKNPDVLFCGYTIPHPSEIKVNFRIQTNKNVTAEDALRKGLSDLSQVCAHVMETFKQAVKEHELTNPAANDQMES